MAASALPVSQKLTQLNEATWLQIGALAESMNEPERAMSAYESALRHNPNSIQVLTQAAALCRTKEQYPKEPKLWYGIGILYDRYGSYEHAEEAFSAVIRMEPKFEKANEIYFRLGIIYKQQGKYETSLGCFRYILSNPPKPLTAVDIWFQIGHVYEQQKEYQLARDAYERVLAENPNHAKVLQQLGWLYHQQNSTFSNQELAIQYLTRSLEADMNDAQTWYLLGRCYMAQQKYNKAYEAYQQAVYRDGRNPTFWCSIGVLYYQINQYRDALDAYSRAIRLNPYISEVWYDLGTLYESCNNQINDALDAYTRALELDPHNPHIKQRLQMLRNAQAGGSQVQPGAAQPQQPVPQDSNAGYPTANGLHHGANHFYQGPQPPNQMGYPRGGMEHRHPSAGPGVDQERRELPAIQSNGPMHYAQPAPQREDSRTERHLLAAAEGSSRNRVKQPRNDRTNSPKSGDRRRQRSREPARVSTASEVPSRPSEDQPRRQEAVTSKETGRPYPEMQSDHYHGQGDLLHRPDEPGRTPGNGRQMDIPRLPEMRSRDDSSHDWRHQSDMEKEGLQRLHHLAEVSRHAERNEEAIPHDGAPSDKSERRGSTFKANELPSLKFLDRGMHNSASSVGGAPQEQPVVKNSTTETSGQDKEDKHREHTTEERPRLPEMPVRRIRLHVAPPPSSATPTEIESSNSRHQSPNLHKAGEETRSRSHTPPSPQEESPIAENLRPEEALTASRQPVGDNPQETDVPRKGRNPQTARTDEHVSPTEPEVTDEKTKFMDAPSISTTTKVTSGLAALASYGDADRSGSTTPARSGAQSPAHEDVDAQPPPKRHYETDSDTSQRATPEPKRTKLNSANGEDDEGPSAPSASS
ncbi:glucose repression mediator protein [Gaertneriomyces sp. JEL0708]|nr:glucose repression mediator protein [Gaertneriomyces sp. JEL0708]